MLERALGLVDERLLLRAVFDDKVLDCCVVVFGCDDVLERTPELVDDRLLEAVVSGETNWM